MKAKKYKFKNLLLLFLLTVFFVSCGSFNKGTTFSKKLDSTNVTLLNGQYEIVAKNEDSIAKRYWGCNNFYKELNRKLIKDTIDLDVTRKYTFNVVAESPNTIKIDYKIDDKIFKSQTFKTKLKKDGFLYLDNKNTRFILIPYIFGALDVKKTRLSVDENNNLIFDVYNHRSGAFMVVGFLDGKTYRYRKIYPKIKREQ